MHDMLLKGGRVIDPANNIDGPMDVAVTADRISAVAVDIPEQNASRVVPVNELIVVPGLVDIHVHAYGGYEGWLVPLPTVLLTEATRT